MRFMLYSKISSQQLWILQRTFASQNRLWICAKSPHAVWIAVATTDADMLNPVGFSEKMKTTMGMPNLPDRSVTCTVGLTSGQRQGAKLLNLEKASNQSRLPAPKMRRIWNLRVR